MIKICSLEFLNKNSFDVDVLSADGSVLYSAGCEITPNLLLKLYYKDIYIEGYPPKKKDLTGAPAEFEPDFNLSDGLSN